VIEWRQEPGRWACHLQRGVSRRIADGWYQHDAEKMIETGRNRRRGQAAT
jgi:hypothetical protein